jgi:hypothetical protein
LYVVHVNLQLFYWWILDTTDDIFVALQ